MSCAYVLIHCDMGYEEHVIDFLKSIKGISEVNGVFGAYDIVVKAEAPTSDGLENVVANIRKNQRIRSTLTLPIIEGQGKS
ncbi:MAG: Lrp/AsnC ligand binding domain-containing protein [Candidatus Nitrosotenuis sp.]